MADGYQVPSAGRGRILIKALVEGEWRNLSLMNVLHMPSFDRNLFSIPNVLERGYKMIGDAKSIKFENDEGVVVAAVKRDGVFVLSIKRTIA